MRDKEALVTIEKKVVTNYGWVCWCGSGNVADKNTIQEAVESWRDHQTRKHIEAENRETFT